MEFFNKGVQKCLFPPMPVFVSAILLCKIFASHCTCLNVLCKQCEQLLAGKLGQVNGSSNMDTFGKNDLRWRVYKACEHFQQRFYYGSSVLNSNKSYLPIRLANSLVFWILPLPITLSFSCVSYLLRYSWSRLTFCFFLFRWSFFFTFKRSLHSSRLVSFPFCHKCLQNLSFLHKPQALKSSPSRVLEIAELFGKFNSLLLAIKPCLQLGLSAPSATVAKVATLRDWKVEPCRINSKIKSPGPRVMLHCRILVKSKSCRCSECCLRSICFLEGSCDFGVGHPCSGQGSLSDVGRFPKRSCSWW